MNKNPFVMVSKTAINHFKTLFPERCVPSKRIEDVIYKLYKKAELQPKLHKIEDRFNFRYENISFVTHGKLLTAIRRCNIVVPKKAPETLQEKYKVFVEYNISKHAINRFAERFKHLANPNPEEKLLKIIEKATEYKSAINDTAKMAYNITQYGEIPKYLKYKDIVIVVRGNLVVTVY